CCAPPGDPAKSLPADDPDGPGALPAPPLPLPAPPLPGATLRPEKVPEGDSAVALGPLTYWTPVESLPESLELSDSESPLGDFKSIGGYSFGKDSLFASFIFIYAWY